MCFAESAADLCKRPTVEGVKTSLQQGVVPRGVANAGNYTYDRSADSVINCVASCCLSSTCEVHYSTVSYLHFIITLNLFSTDSDLHRLLMLLLAPESSAGVLNKGEFSLRGI